MARFGIQLSNEIYQTLEKEAKARGIQVHDLIRAVVVPEWMMQNNVPPYVRGRDTERPSTS